MKPIGAFSSDGAPAWITFGGIADFATDAELEAAATRSRASGFSWVLQLGYGIGDLLGTSIRAHVSAVRRRFEAAGVWPHVVAVTFREEWYEALGAGAFARYGLTGADFYADVPILNDWLGLKHAEILDAIGMGRPIVWITTLVNNDPAFGPGWYRPVPPGVGIVAVDAYTPAAGTFATHVEPVLRHAETTTRLPLVMIPRWFQDVGGQASPWTQAPPIDSAEGYARIFAGPRWIAMWGFLWGSRPWSGIRGLDALPEFRAAVERSLSVSGQAGSLEFGRGAAVLLHGRETVIDVDWWPGQFSRPEGMS